MAKKKPEQSRDPLGTIVPSTQPPEAQPESPPDAPQPTELERELTTIYEPGNEKRDMTKLEIAKSSLAKKIMVGLIIFFAALAAVSWAGFFFFSPAGDKFSGEGVALAIEGPAEPKGGELVTYTFRYKNGESVPLGTATLTARIPKELKVIETDPAADKNEWNVGSISPGKENAITVKAIAMAPLQKSFDLQAILSYRPADFNSEFQKVTTRSLTVTDSVLELAVTGPAKVLPGDKVTYAYEYKNPSTQDFQHLRFVPVYPSSFIPESATPKAENNSHLVWNIASLKAGGSGKITVTGTFSSEAKGDLDLKGQIGIVDADGDFLLQRESGQKVTVLEGQLVTNLILNGKTESQATDFGDILRYALTWRNTGVAALGDVTLSIVFETQPASPKILLWNNLKDEQGGVRDGNKLTWTKKQVTKLGAVGANQEGTIDFELPILAAPIGGLNASEYVISSWIEATIGSIDGEAVTRTVKSQPLVVKINSDTKLAAEARYFNQDDIPIGSGPLPPAVGQQTVYRVSWKLTNALHELTDLKISAPMVSNVIWTGASNVDAGNLKFDAGADKMVWTLNRMPTSVKSLGVSFDIGFTPSDDQRGKIATILSATTLEAIDKVTGALVIMSLPPLTTDLENDAAAAGKSKVQ